MGKLTNPSAPVVLSKKHDTKNFDCGNHELNNYLKHYAMLNQQASAARTFVSCKKNTVIGFYSLAVGSVEHQTAPKRIKQGLARHPIPVMILARLAVDQKYQRQNIGTGLLKDTVTRTLQVSEIAGIRAIFVHAKDEKARKFYQHFDFEPSPINPLKLMLLLKDARKTINKILP